MKYLSWCTSTSDLGGSSRTYIGLALFNNLPLLRLGRIISSQTFIGKKISTSLALQEPILFGALLSCTWDFNMQ
ncbi:MAG TPA: hypothetical protein EYH00_03220, partial [Archaeoglobus profundus]|nr:hypothetical protein [Archaeoglobus profundus]